MGEKLSIIVTSGTVDKLMAASIIASGAASMDMEVNMFFAFWAVLAAKKDTAAKNDKLPAEYAEFKQPMFEAFRKLDMKPWYELLKEAKAGGKLKIYACSATLDMFGLKKEDLLDIFDDVVGVGSFIIESEDADIVSF